MSSSEAYPEWIKDADRLLACVPPDDPIRTRCQYLVDTVARRGVPVETDDMRHLRVPARYRQRENFKVIEVPEGLDPAKTPPGTANLVLGKTIEQVNIDENFQAMFLQRHSQERPMGNGMILLHALEHITEVEDGFPYQSPDMELESYGTRERRAYATNKNILEGVDGSDWQRYCDSLPFSVTIDYEDNGAYTAGIDTRGFGHVAPPAETLMYDLWTENQRSRSILRNTVLCSLLVQHTLSDAEHVTDTLIAHELSSIGARAAEEAGDTGPL